MGLDMYMYRANRDEVTLPEYPEGMPHAFAKKSEEEITTQRQYWDAIENAGVYKKSEEVAYWRKFNALHGYLVDNCQDGIDECQYSEVTKEVLEELIELIEQSIEDNCPVPDLAPRDGFFFGSTDIDDWFWQDMKETLPKLKEILSSTDFEKQILIYHSSW